MASWSIDKALIIQCVMLVDRIEYLPLLQRYDRDPDRLLILDRYYLSGLVYGRADGLDRLWLSRIHASLPMPDVFFLLDIPVSESVRRRPDRRDYYEKNTKKLEQVRQLYLEQDNKFVVDGTLEPDQISEAIETITLEKRAARYF
jgi:thymidylate kinase